MERVYVGSTNHITVICPKCELTKSISVFKFKNTHKRLKAKCKCGEVFRFTLDFRKYYRKIIRLSGEYFIHERGEKGEILIKNISMIGINFETLKSHNFSENDIVELKFALDNSVGMVIHTLVKIKWINNRNVGVQYIDQTHLKQDLTFFLKI